MWNEKRARDGIGMLSPTTRPPAPSAGATASTSARTSSTVSAEIRTMFQFNGRRAAVDIDTRTSRSTGPNTSTRPGMNSSAVPSNSPQTADSASSSERSAARDGTGAPAASKCAGPHDDVNPSAPARRPSRSSAVMAAISSDRAVRSVASSPITTRRRAEWPTEKPAFTPRVPSSRSRYSAVERQSPGTPACSASRGMPSTTASMRTR